MDIIPISSTADVSDIQKIIKGKSLMELKGQGLNDGVINRRYLEALQIEDVQEILDVPEQEPPWEQIKEQAELELKDRELKLETQKVSLQKIELMEKSIKTRAEAIRALADAESKEEGIQLDVYKSQTDRIKEMMDAEVAMMEAINGANERNVSNVAQGKPNNGGGVSPVGRGPAAAA